MWRFAIVRLVHITGYYLYLKINLCVAAGFLLTAVPFLASLDP